MAELETEYYVRLAVADQPGVLAAVATVFGAHGVSIGSVIQKRAEGGVAQIVYVTHTAREADVRSALAEIESLDVVTSIAAVIRVEEL
jgi:homoserine dehydrogenase